MKKLLEEGIDVTVGVLEEEAKSLNRVFIKNMSQKLPYVVLKTATTMDGKIATKTGSSKWITSEKSRAEVYEMRQQFDCIMTSSNTVIADNPTMEHKFKCILDKDMRISPDAKIYEQGEIYVASRKNTSLVDGGLDLREILSTLYQKGICTVFVECGGTLAGALLREGLIDEIFQFIAPKIVNDNSAKSCFDGDEIFDISDCKQLQIYETKLVAKDLLIKSLVTNQKGEI